MVPGYTRLAQAATQPTHVTDVAHLFSPFTYCHPLIAYHVLLGSIDIYAYFYLQFFEIQKQNILFTLLGRHQAHFASLLTSVAQRHDLTTEVSSQCRVKCLSFSFASHPSTSHHYIADTADCRVVVDTFSVIVTTHSLY